MATNWQTGDLIEKRWQVYKVLRGGMGVVHVVYDHEHRTPYAAKTFQEAVFALSPGVAERFTQEALTWVNLDAHQNITEARFVQTIAGKPYLFLEFVSGGDLSQWVGTPRLTEDLPQLLRFAIQFCDGMIHALSKGMTAHRDIKPQNCLVTQDHTLKVTDFGLAKVFNDEQLSGMETAQTNGLGIGLTRTGAAAGTCTHMAPEQFDDAKHVDLRADVYSFGVMLFQMLTGRLPFMGRTWEEFEQLHKTQRVPPLERQPRELSRIVERCLAKDAADRYRDFGEVRDDLAEVYEQAAREGAPRPARGEALSEERWNNKGVSLSHLGRDAEALACFEHALKINPRSVSAWLNKGVSLSESGRHEEALDCYDRVLEINPDDYRAWANKGNALGELGRTEESHDCYDKAIAINPLDEAAWTNKGLDLIEQGRFEEALNCCKRAVELNPRNEKTWTNEGLALYRLGRLEEALACYDRALEINPNSKKAWTDKGLTLKKLGRNRDALDCHERALAIDPRFAVAWSNKGVVLVESGRTEEALDCFVRAVEIDPRYTQAWINRGLILSGLGRHQDALSCYDRVLEINPRFATAWTNKGVVREAMGEYEEALACFDRALELDPKDEHAWFNMGAVWANNFQRYHEAVLCFEKAYRLGHPQALQGIALCLKKAGR